MSIVSIAHRGASGVAPENTMLSFWTAITSNVDIIELDVQITKDKELVIFHDRSLSRITGEDQGIVNFTLQKLKQKDVGTWKNKLFNNTRIPTFAEVLQELPVDVSYIVEVKPQFDQIEENRTLERLMLDCLDDNTGKTGIGNGYISARDVETLQWFKVNTNKYSLGLMQKKRSFDEFYKIIKENRIEYSQIRWRNYSEEEFIKLRNTGTKTMVYFADFPEEWDFLIKNNVDGILTNYPSLLSGYLKQKI
ncbi:MAG: Glycerophosphoryl diester phosphodiesterase [Candidatus Heimdallarchaeota archaeon LC_2]|nr:MAG: Glycerophosphoryl diester phosphodiesterase [Candidatus Heimdallarchaeota archaeon LC_2]